MPKRKPPSQRPEAKLDDMARAIAEQREEARTEKSPKTNRVGLGNLKPQTDQAGAGHRRNAPVAPASSTRRRKTGGG